MKEEPSHPSAAVPGVSPRTRFGVLLLNNQLCDTAPSVEAPDSIITGVDAITGSIAEVFARDGLLAFDDLRLAADLARVAATFVALSAFFNSFTSLLAALAAFFASL